MLQDGSLSSLANHSRVTVRLPRIRFPRAAWNSHPVLLNIRNVTRKGDSMKNRARRRGGVMRAVLGISITVLMLGTGAVSANAVEPDAYLQDYTASDGLIPGDNGNRAGYSSELCGFEWSAQSVIDTDLEDYSQNGFLESVQPLGDPRLPGSGWAQLQHWVNGADLENVSNDQLNWRIPIALDSPLASAQVTMVFDDHDWTPNQSSFQQYSTWPDRASAFNRFMGDGVGIYQPHDDSQVTPSQWGTNADGFTTLTFNLGIIEAGTSTVLQFSGTAADGAAGIQSGTSYGAKLTLDGTQPLTICLTPAYSEQTVLTGETAESDPALSEAASGDATPFPAGTSFALGADAPTDVAIDSATGEVTWPVPGTQPVGDVAIPVSVTYSDGSTDETSALIHVTKEPRLGPFEDQQIMLGDPIEDVLAELKDHLGLLYGDGSTVQVEGLPDGVTFDPVSGVISGTPTATGEYPVTATGVDADGRELVSTVFTITVTDGDDGAVPPAETEHPEQSNTLYVPESPATDERLATTGRGALGGLATAGLLSLLAGGMLLGRRMRRATH